jgi:hypothetical protein
VSAETQAGKPVDDGLFTDTRVLEHTLEFIRFVVEVDEVLRCGGELLRDAGDDA